jgi:glycosyltransferase involved in cell wall biosynthesis
MLTVLLATRNRAQILRDVLEAYCLVEEPPAGWKLVVVDNGSADKTHEVIKSFRGRLPLHFIVEPKLGKNHALNAGLGAVEGDLVVFTDDDAFPRVDWLIQLRKAADTRLEFSVFGGAVVPRWEVAPPGWIDWVHRGPVFTITDPAQADEPVAPYLVFGPNMAIRANLFQSGVCFDPSIGPRGSDYPMGSETELLLRLDRQGHKAWHVGGAVVEHLIRKEQLTETWVFKRAIRYGRGFYRLFSADKSSEESQWMGVPRQLLGELRKEWMFSIAAWVCRKQEAHFRSRWNVNFLRGQAIEARRIARSRRAGEQFPSQQHPMSGPGTAVKEP